MPALDWLPPQAGLLFAAGVISGALNALAGGGGLIGFPALIIAGLPPINANATSTVASWPGVAASIAVYRRELTFLGRELAILSATSACGGLVGAVLLLVTPSTVFQALVPFLILVATILFAFGGPINRWISARRERSPVGANADKAVRASQFPAQAAVAMFILAIYGGYYGGGLGLLMLALMAVSGLTDLRQMQAIRVVLAAAINLLAVITFAIAGAVYWPQALLMMTGSVTGGYLSARYIRQVNQSIVRGAIVAVGAGMTVYFFLR